MYPSGRRAAARNAGMTIALSEILAELRKSSAIAINGEK
jgi:hypothetical protein